jgi:3-hydroxyacyl-CoA dehydrogenase
MQYSETVGLKNIYERILEFHAKHGQLWDPAPLLKKLAEEGGEFSDYERF